MKKILEKLAAIADEADAAGNFKIASDIDSVIKAFAAEMPNPPPPDANQAVPAPLAQEPQPPVAAAPVSRIQEFEAFMKLSSSEKERKTLADKALASRVRTAPTVQEIIDVLKLSPQDAQRKAAEFAKKAKAELSRQRLATGKQKLQEIADMYIKNNKPAPFALPSGPLLYKDLMFILGKAGMGKDLSSWKDMDKRLYDIRALVFASLFANKQDKDPFNKLRAAPDTASGFVAIPTPSIALPTKAGPMTAENTPTARPK